MKPLQTFLLLLLISLNAYADDPQADPRAIVTAGNARFTVLTPQLLRMEWSANGTFEDHASLVFLNRRLTVPTFTVRNDSDQLILQTSNLTLRYKRNSGKFASDNLSVEFLLNGTKVVWRPGMEDKGNLKGTTRTLDGVQGATKLEPGLLSRDGWTVVDDSDRPLYDQSEWPWVVPRADGQRQDLYFFGYGHEYKKALYDFTRVAGKIPLPPRFAFGIWWSRYWAYTDQEFKELVREFETHEVPLDVLVIDMDWHQTFNLRWDTDKRDQAGQRLGWTGYTWDKAFFPDPKGFLSWCSDHGLRTPLNIHPASGIQPHEEAYPAMARAMGVDPQTRKYIPFDIVDKKFAKNYLDLVLRPLERQGVDFWWLDWQQWGTTKIPGVTPTWWLNYVFFTDMERQGVARPLLFHRWGGLGNHRYQIGFSGDAISVWESLAFQPYFTATAANVGFGFWSHDIGGHMPGPVSAELYTRWIQFGVFSPILRTHTTKNPEAERRIWAYSSDDFKTMREAFLLRHALIPYIYSSARQAYDTGVSICRPLYYEYPEAAEAYTFDNEYLFGDRMLVAPIASPIAAESLLASTKLWLPPGEWIEWSTGNRLKGNAVMERCFSIDQIPVYVKAGSVIPMQPALTRAGDNPSRLLQLAVFPGDSGSTRIYEDQGNSLGYKKDECAWTEVKFDGREHVIVAPVQGRFPGMTEARAFEISLFGELPPLKVSINGKGIPFVQNDSAEGWRYDGDHLATIIRTAVLPVDRSIEIDVLPSLGSRELTDGVPGLLARLKRVMPLINNQWPKEWSPDVLVEAAQTGNRIGISPSSAESELRLLRERIPEIVRVVPTLKIDPAVARRVLWHLSAGR